MAQAFDNKLSEFKKEIADMISDNDAPTWTKNAKHFVVSHIGCMECNVESGIVGIFTDWKVAMLVAEKYSLKLEWNEGGQNKFEVFPIDIDKINVDLYSKLPMVIRSKDFDQKLLVQTQIGILDDMIKNITASSAHN